MTTLLDRIARERQSRVKKAATYAEPPFWAQPEPLFVGSTPTREKIDVFFENLIADGLKASSPLLGCTQRRAQVFSQGRFQWIRHKNGIPSDPFGTNDTLGILERPWPLGTTGELLTRMEIDASAAGNSYWTQCDDAGNLGKSATGTGLRLVRLRPDWCTLIINAPSGNPFGPDTRVVGLAYDVPIRQGNYEQRSWLFVVGEFIHYSPLPDPIARFRGMSWMTTVLEEIATDKAATIHKGKVLANGAHFGHAVKFDKDIEEDAFLRFIARFNKEHRGPEKAWKTLFLTPGADMVPLSMDLHQLDLRALQGHGETRVCVAAGVPAPLTGVSEGLAGSALNAGNLTALRRLFIDTTIRDLWNKVAPSCQALIKPPPSRFNEGPPELIIDSRFIPFVREDASDAANVQSTEAATITALTREGFTPESAIAAVRNHDWTLLVHTGALSVQLHTPGESPTPGNGMVPMNGNGMTSMMAAMGANSNGH
jgi:hypothetical protein